MTQTAPPEQATRPPETPAGRGAERDLSAVLGSLWKRLLPPRPPVELPPDEDDRPWPVRAVFLAVGALAGMISLLLVAAALLPRISNDVTNAVEVALILPDDADLQTLPERSTIRSADGTLLAVLHDEVDRRVIPLEAVPEHVRQAVITAEDRRFYEHDGYDPEGIGRAALANLQARGISQGGSTITQQLAKNNFVGDALTLERKIRELLYAMALEERFTKDELLERYLNQVYFGGGAYGIQAAAEEFFRKHARDLTIDEAALLAGMIRSPGGLDPRRFPEDAKARRDRILRDMATEGYLTQAQARRLQALPVEVVPPRQPRPREPYIVEAIKQEFFANPAFGPTRQDRIDRLFSGGLEIITTIDLELQEAAREVVEQSFGSGGVTAAIAAVDPGTGEVRALHSGEDFDEEQYNLATQGRRQPGSAIKPFVMATALAEGFPPSLTLDGRSGVKVVYDRNRVYEPENYGGANYGQINMREALRRSVNTYFVQLLMLVGIDDAIDMMGRFGIDTDAAFGPPASRGPAIGLGGVHNGITPLEMASGYAVFGNQGVHVRPHLIARVTQDGQELLGPELTEQRVLDPAVNALAVDLLRGVVEGGTGAAARISGWQIAGKTGTTQQSADAWFVGTTPVLATAVWVGHPDEQVPMPGATGGGVAAPVWRAFMERALAGMDPVPFPDVDVSDAVRGGEVEVPDVRGLDQAEALLELARAKLVGSVQRVDAFAARDTVVWQSPRGGADARVGDRVTIGVSTGRPPTVEVPGLVGLTRAQAMSRLSDVGLRGNVELVASPVPEGVVVGQRPSAGTPLTRGDTVGLQVSTGPPEPATPPPPTAEPD